MRQVVLKVAAVILFGLMFAGVSLVAVLAVRADKTFVWKNYWHQPIPAWGLIVTLVPMAVIGAIWAGQRLWRRFGPGRPT